jgi:hypothetical protein
MTVSILQLKFSKQDLEENTMGGKGLDGVTHK